MEDILIQLGQFWIIFYPGSGLALVIFYYSFPKLKEGISLISEIINIIFGLWLLAVETISLIETKKERGNFFYESDLSEWVVCFSVVGILIGLCFRKVRRSPFSILVVCVILFINYLIIMASFQVGV